MYLQFSVKYRGGGDPCWFIQAAFWLRYCVTTLKYLPYCHPEGNKAATVFGCAFVCLTLWAARCDDRPKLKMGQERQLCAVGLGEFLTTSGMTLIHTVALFELKKNILYLPSDYDHYHRLKNRALLVLQNMQQVFASKSGLFSLDAFSSHFFHFQVIFFNICQ